MPIFFPKLTEWADKAIDFLDSPNVQSLLDAYERATIGLPGPYSLAGLPAVLFKAGNKKGLSKLRALSKISDAIVEGMGKGVNLSRAQRESTLGKLRSHPGRGGIWARPNLDDADEYVKSYDAAEGGEYLVTEKVKLENPLMLYKTESPEVSKDIIHKFLGRKQLIPSSYEELAKGLSFSYYKGRKLPKIKLPRNVLRNIKAHDAVDSDVENYLIDDAIAAFLLKRAGFDALATGFPKAKSVFWLPKK